MNDLDAEELFHLALKASDDGDREKSISYLKQSIALEPQANSLYILAAEYAELGMMHRATELMRQALELNPELWTAWFQLGLLYLSQNYIQEARSAWDNLVELGEDSYLHHLATGMNLLIDEKIEDSLEALAQGMEMNDDNPALNGDITNIINSVLASVENMTHDETGAPGAGPVAETGEADSGASGENEAQAHKQHLLVSKYGNSE
jgi:tetratricopeptide (TPR) repeat protein